MAERNRKNGRPAVGWDLWYATAKGYYQREGDLLVPARYISESGLRLGYWITRLRQERKSGKLSADAIADLDAIGMVWDVEARKDRDWTEAYHSLAEFCERHGGFPRKGCDQILPDGESLLAWMKNQKLYFQRGALPAERVRLLQEIGFLPLEKSRTTWEDWLALARRYRERHGDLLVPATYVSEGKALGAWISNQRQFYRRGQLSPQRIADLNACGMVWNTRKALPPQREIA